MLNYMSRYRGAYYSAVSWADYCAGQVIAALDRLGLAQHTAVVVHSDHGWHLGEYHLRVTSIPTAIPGLTDISLRFRGTGVLNYDTE
jgi:arylsulfatase A-like enzyme